MMLELPRELMIYILAYLGPDDLVISSSVCKSWKDIIKDRRLRELVEERNFYFDQKVFNLNFKFQIFKNTGEDLLVDGMKLKFVKCVQRWQTSRARIGYRKGVHYWEILVDQLHGGTNSWYIYSFSSQVEGKL
jgi:hypothetical protein